MHRSLGLGLSAAAVIATALTPAAGWAAVNSTAAYTSASSSSPAAGDPNTTVTATVSSTGVLSMTAPASQDLGTGGPGATLSALLGNSVVTDARSGTLSWIVDASSTAFTTTIGPAETIPVADASYTVGTITTGGAGTVSPTGTNLASLSTTPTPVINTTGVSGDNFATWDPTEALHVPTSAVAGAYTSTLTESVA